MAEMLVPPLRGGGIRGDLHGSVGAKMQDGSVYTADRHGRMLVEDSGHVRAMKKDPAVAGDIVERTFHVHVEAGRYCAPCNFSAWPWTRVCPRCGASLIDEQEENSCAD